MEKKFSANFQMYNRDGLRIQFTVREDEAAEHLRLLSLTLDRLNQEGYSVSEPDSNAKPKVVPIVAYVRSTAQDSKTNSFMPCVHLYSPWGNFKAATVYHEKLEDLPFNWQGVKLWDGAAPDRENATKRGVLISCEEFSIVMVPRMDYEGNVKRTDSGNIIYAYDRVVSHKDGPQATQSAPPPNRTTQHRSTPQRPANPVKAELDAITVADSEPMGWDSGSEWDGMAADAAAAEAADKKAKQPFVWPVSEEALELCTGLYNAPDCPKRVADMSEYFAKKSVNSDGAMTDKQYQYLGSLIDKRYSGGHNAILSAVCQHVVNGEHKPGFDVKELLDWMIKPEANAGKLQVLDALVEFLKADIAQFEVA